MHGVGTGEGDERTCEGAHEAEGAAAVDEKSVLRVQDVREGDGGGDVGGGGAGGGTAAGGGGVRRGEGGGKRARGGDTKRR